jgi:hypothetical protein
MIEPIPNQPVSFLQSLTQGCACLDDIPSYIGEQDELRFQVKYRQCGDSENLVSSDITEWTPQPFTWAFIGAAACIHPFSPGQTLSYPAFSPTPGQAYRLVIDAVQLVGPFMVTMGGVEHIISGTAGFDLFFLPGNSDPLTFYPIAAESEGCIQGGIYLYELDGDITVAFMDGEDELFSVDVADEPEYFTFINGGINVAMPFSATGLDPGDCFTIRITDNCDETALESQRFMVVADDDCRFIAVRACNDSDAMGFTNPFAPRIRIPATYSRPVFTYDVVEERHSNGRNLRPYADREREMVLGTDPLNEADLNFVSALPVFSHVYIGDQEVFVTAKSLEPAYADIWSATGAVQVSVKPKEELLRNVQCGPELAGCAPQDDPICNRPNIIFSWTDNVLRASYVSTAGYVVGTIQVLSGAYDSGELPFDPPPSDLEFGPFPDGQETTVLVTNPSVPLCNYRRDLNVPIFDCANMPGSISFSLGTGGALFIQSTVTDFIYRNSADGSRNPGVEGNVYFIEGAFCMWPTDGVLGDPSGHIIQLILYAVEYLDFSALATIQVLELHSPTLTFVDLSSIANLEVLILEINLAPTIDLSTSPSVEEISLSVDAMASLDLTGLPNLRNISVVGAILTTVTVDPAAAYQLADFTGCQLDVASVDAIANGCDATHPTGTLDLSGGTNAPPTASSLTNRLALIANGWTVTTN